MGAHCVRGDPPVLDGGNYVNFHTADDSRARIDEAYGGSLERLARVKAAYDADNLFRVNRNIAPAASSAVASAV